MPLSAAQQQKMTAWVQTKGANAVCGACGQNNWSAGDVVAAPVMEASGNINIGGPSVPMAQLICNNCAYVMLFAAVPIGLVG